MDLGLWLIRNNLGGDNVFVRGAQILFDGDFLLVIIARLLVLPVLVHTAMAANAAAAGDDEKNAHGDQEPNPAGRCRIIPAHNLRLTEVVSVGRHPSILFGEENELSGGIA